MKNKNKISKTSPIIINSFPKSSTPNLIGQCDACPGSDSIHYNIKKISLKDSVLYSTPFSKVKINQEYYALHSPWTSYAPFVVNKPMLKLVEHFSHKNTVTSIADITYEEYGNENLKNSLEKLANFGLLSTEDYIEQPIIEKKDTLTAWIHVTDKCNLRCSYCYLPHKPISMTSETGKEAIEIIFRSASIYGFKRIKLKYAGGEPILNFSLIIILHQYAQALSEEYEFDLDGVVISNGTLISPEIINNIKSLGLRLTISLDGLGDLNDCQRYYCNKKGAANDINRAIKLALERDLTPHISITVTSLNCDGLPQLIKWTLDQQLPFAIKFFTTNNFASPIHKLEFNEIQIINSLRAVYKLIEANLPNQSLLASLLDTVNLAIPHLRVCGVGCNYLVFDCEGKVAKCQMQIDKSVATTKEKDPLKLIQNDKKGLQNFTVSEKEECKSCEWKYWCAGGCPLVTYNSVGSYCKKSPFCDIYKTLLPEVLRLEGLRLLNNNGISQVTRN